MAKGVNIDLRKEFDYMINNFGIPVLYVRRNKFVRCSCYNELHKCGDPNCKACLGSGFLNILEPKDTLKSYSRYNLNCMEQSPIGSIDTEDVVFNINFKQQPNKKDLIIQPLYDSNGLITGVDSVYEIYTKLNINGDSGRTELYTIGCKTRNDRMIQIKKVINSLSKNDKIALKMKKPVRCKVGD